MIIGANRAALIANELTCHSSVPSTAQRNQCARSTSRPVPERPRRMSTMRTRTLTAVIPLLVACSAAPDSGSREEVTTSPLELGSAQGRGGHGKSAVEHVLLLSIDGLHEQ